MQINEILIEIDETFQPKIDNAIWFCTSRHESRFTSLHMSLPHFPFTLIMRRWNLLISVSAAHNCSGRRMPLKHLTPHVAFCLPIEFA
jgi:hypothetical protein